MKARNVDVKITHIEMIVQLWDYCHKRERLHGVESSDYQSYGFPGGILETPNIGHILDIMEQNL